jgi:hypothetical protein
MALRFAPARAVGLPPFIIVTGRAAILPSQLMEWALPEDPEDPSTEKLDDYIDLTLEGVEPLT